MDNQYLKLKFLDIEPLVYKPYYNEDIWEVFSIVDEENNRIRLFVYKNGEKMTVHFCESYKMKKYNTMKENYFRMEYEVLEGLYPKSIRITFRDRFYSKNYRIAIHEIINNFRGCASKSYGNFGGK